MSLINPRSNRFRTSPSTYTYKPYLFPVLNITRSRLSCNKSRLSCLYLLRYYVVDSSGRYDFLSFLYYYSVTLTISTPGDTRFAHTIQRYTHHREDRYLNTIWLLNILEVLILYLWQSSVFGIRYQWKEYEWEKLLLVYLLFHFLKWYHSNERVTYCNICPTY